MEYLFEITDQNHRRSTITDPANPRRVAGAFGDKSVLEFPGYRAPSWLALQSVPASEKTLDVAAGEFQLSCTVWSPDGVEGAVPLLVVHDGPEYATLGGLTHYLGALIGTGALPPMRAALVDPGDRNDWYSANAGYARAVRDELIPALDEAAPSDRRIGLGASLGALAMLHFHRAYPGVLDGLFLQSGSFFTPQTDDQESEFSGFAAVTSFVRTVTDAPDDPAPVPTVLTCGTVEENLTNNRLMTAALQRIGYSAELFVVRDAHNYTAWRDALDPSLTGLIGEVARAA